MSPFNLFNLSDFNGVFFHLSRIIGNPIACKCDLAWLLSESNFLKSIRGNCEDGTDLKNLNLDCQVCPYKCVGLQQASFCTPGTVKSSNVGNCQKGEICCQPSISMPSVTTVTTTEGMSSCPVDFGYSCVNAEYKVFCNEDKPLLLLACPSKNQVCCQIGTSSDHSPKPGTSKDQPHPNHDNCLCFEMTVCLHIARYSLTAIDGGFHLNSWHSSTR